MRTERRNTATAACGNWRPCHAAHSSRTLWRALACLLIASAVLAVGDASVFAASPPFAERVLYAPGHFGNSYEVMGEYEMRQVLAEAKHWGFNRYSDWFDMEDCVDLFAEKRLVQLAHVMWEIKKQNFRSAMRLKLPCDLLVTPNHVYIDQCRAGLLAEKKGRVFGQLICPSLPEARKLILANYENLFGDLARSGVRLNSLSACPYDFGGCACSKCKPWILTYAGLTREIYAIAVKHHPGIEMRMVGWWWQPEEHRQFADWADRHAPDWLKVMYLHIPYGKTSVGDVPLPKGCRRGAFVHIGYADQAQPRDVYGHTGPVIAAARLQETVTSLARQGVTDVMAYSEGVFDDVNKCLLAGLGSGKHATADDVLAAYARRYFDAGDKTAAWVAWLRLWGTPFSVDTERSGRQLAALSEGTPPGTWRRRQWELKQELFRCNAVVSRGTAWTPERLAAADQFWQVHEQLQRGVWGLAVLRHCFDKRFTPVPWYADWARHTASQVGKLGKEQ